MAAVSRILNVLVILAAVAALVIGLKLAGHREAARKRADAYSSVIKNTADELDKGSGTNTGGGVTQLTWQDWEGNPSGTDAAAKTVTAAATTVIAQRDGLADGIVDLGKTVEVAVNPDDLKLVEGYAAHITTVNDRLKAINARDKVIADELHMISKTIGQKVEADSLLDLEDENYRSSLDSLTGRMDTVNRLYGLHITTLKEIVKAAAPGLQFTDEEYEKADPAKVEQLIANLGELQRAMTENVVLKRDNATLKDDNKKLTTDLADLRVEYAALEERCTDGPIKPEVEEFNNDGPLSGEIVSVNYELNYVVINFGKNRNLQETTTLAIARDREYICSVVVTEVFSKYAVCDILPDQRGGTVIPGDSVIHLDAE